MNFRTHWLALVVVSGLAAAFAVGCDQPDTGCTADADCAGARCETSTGTCVTCLATSDCADGEACCQGACRAGTAEELCGCEAATTGAAPSACSDDVCVNEAGTRVALADLATGACQCPCDPAIGGTLCTVNDSERGFACGCDRTDPVTTCEAAAIDATGVPHRPADTCSPELSCVCFAAAAVCPGSADCTTGGCVDLVTDGTNCGVANRTCDNDATGTAGGTCVGGGCTCNAASDCQAAGLNVDACAFIGDVSQCVCDDYTTAGVKAPCPMGLACVEGGCQFEGAVFADRDALVAAVAAR